MNNNIALLKERLKTYFPKQEETFMTSLKEKSKGGFFLNTKKASALDLLKEIDFPYTPSLLNKDSYFHQSSAIGYSPAYILGLIYVQEPSASLPISFIDGQEINLAVDLCAAPGGKSLGLLTKINDESLLISNDISYKRALILSSNVERLGFSNVMVTSLSTKILAKELSGKADLVILDAPCSGEGMLRKEKQVLKDYSLTNIKACARRQSELLEDAYNICSRGGKILYSTCTYAKEENEDNIKQFLTKHDDMTLCSLNHPLAKNKMLKVSILDGSEGQFVAIMKKRGQATKPNFKYYKTIKEETVDTYIKNNLFLDKYYLYANNNRYYLSLYPLPSFNLPFLRYGIPIGNMINKRLVLEHSFFRANILSQKWRNKYDCCKEEFLTYISGEEILSVGQSADILLTYHDYPFGYGHRSENRIKNKYPKGLRRVL